MTGDDFGSVGDHLLVLNAFAKTAQVKAPSIQVGGGILDPDKNGAMAINTTASTAKVIRDGWFIFWILLPSRLLQLIIPKVPQYK